MARMKTSFSVGTDIVEVPRIKKLIHQERFLRRIFSPEEIRYCKDKKNAEQHFAVRFAAKEAVWKALGSILHGKGISHREIQVRRAPSGQPFVQLSSRLKKFESRISLSLSHTEQHAVAVAFFQAR